MPVLLTTPLGSLRQAGPHLKCKVKSLQQGHTQPSTSLDHRGSHTLNWLPFCLQRFESIFRVLYFPFLFKNKNCLRYIEFCFGRTRCVFPTLRPLVRSLSVSVCLAGSLHCCTLVRTAAWLGLMHAFCLTHLSFTIGSAATSLCLLFAGSHITSVPQYTSLPPVQTLKWGPLLEAIPVRKRFPLCYSVEST